MGIFEPVQVALVEGYWRVKVNVSADAAEYVTHDRAMTLAEELASEGWRESALQIRKAAEAARRFSPMASISLIKAAIEYRRLRRELETQRQTGNHDGAAQTVVASLTFR